ncbi:MAG: S1/P1 nuclease [Alistipes sp.]|nr:S1/P1 nuclease [Alistipes sp.]
MKRLLITFIALCSTLSSFGWGQKGHDIVAYIAECNLSPKSYRKVVAVLEGHSPVYYANWLDGASHTPEYAYTKTWHYANVDEGNTYQTQPRNKAGDVVQAVSDIVEKLKSGTLSPEEENVNLRMLIHLVGDMHCPMHAGRLSDRGGNGVKVKYFGKSRKLHAVWDSELVESAHRWGYTEWQREIDRADKKTKREIVAGTPLEWFEQTHTAAVEVYKYTPDGSSLSYDYVTRFTPMVEEQLLRGGLRLARLLNEIYR